MGLAAATIAHDAMVFLSKLSWAFQLRIKPTVIQLQARNRTLHLIEHIRSASL